LIYYPNWVFCSDLLPQLGFRHELYGRVKSIQKPIFGVDVESSIEGMCTFPLDVISNYGIFYLSIDIVMITQEDTALLHYALKAVG
jgi:hypothetical protein